MARCVFVYTAQGNDYPEKIELSILDDGRIALTVSGPRKPESAGIRFFCESNSETAIIPREEAWALSAALRQAMLLT